jgi:hypothetical protein
MERIMPQCEEWPRFREWAVVLSSCQASFTPEQKLSRAYFHLFAAISACHWLLGEYKYEGKELTGIFVGKDNQKGTIDIFGVCEIIYWMLKTLDPNFNPSFEGRWGPDFLPPNVTAPATTRATKMVRELGLFPNRFWNLALVSERKQVDSPGLMETAVNHPQLRQDKHD